jgi:hypothetical protein
LQASALTCQKKKEKKHKRLLSHQLLLGRLQLMQQAWQEQQQPIGETHEEDNQRHG